MTPGPDPGELLAEIERLKERLAEAEDMLRATAGGEVDGFVVGPGDKCRVLLLSNAYQRYRQIIERIQQGAVTVLAAGGDIVFANRNFADRISESLAELFSEPLQSYVEHNGRGPLRGFLAAGKVGSQIDVSLMRGDGVAAPVRLTLAVFMEGYASLIVSDLAAGKGPIDDSAADTVNALREGRIDGLVIRDEEVVLLERRR